MLDPVEDLFGGRHDAPPGTNIFASREAAFFAESVDFAYTQWGRLNCATANVEAMAIIAAATVKSGMEGAGGFIRDLGRS
jgi:hypothetical protein